MFKNFDFEKLPTLTKLFLAPCLGALFVIFLPVIGFYLVGHTLISKLYALHVRGNEPLANSEK